MGILQDSPGRPLVQQTQEGSQGMRGTQGGRLRQQGQVRLQGWLERQVQEQQRRLSRLLLRLGWQRRPPARMHVCMSAVCAPVHVCDVGWWFGVLQDHGLSQCKCVYCRITG